MILKYNELAHSTQASWAMSTAKEIGSLTIIVPTAAPWAKSGTRFHHGAETCVVRRIFDTSFTIGEDVSPSSRRTNLPLQDLKFAD